MRNLSLGLLAAVTALACACSLVEDDPACTGGKCDDTNGFTSKLDGRNDPIAKALRASDIGGDGILKADYGDIVRAIAAVQGCGEDTWKTYVVSDPLVEDEPFPRLVSTVCSNDPTKASEFFIAASFKDPVENDVDVYNLEAFAWDADAGVYRFYGSVEGTPEEIGKHGAIAVEVEPERCRECHLTPGNLPTDGMRMTPIMNELTQPWSHWNAQVPMFNEAQNPFASHDFEVPADVREAPNFVKYGRDRVGSAADLEQIIRAGHARVAGERAKERRGTATDWRPAMNLLRPLFCEEQVQYATEDFQTGLLNVTAIIPGGVREAYRAIRPDNWAWEWFNNQDSRVRLQPPGEVTPITMMPIRGSVDVDYEARLLGARALTPNQILRIRALDWKRPVLSSLRCGLWRDALARFTQTPPTLDLSGRIAAHMKVLYDLIMTVDGTPITTGEETSFIALDQAAPSSARDLAAAVAGGTVATDCAVGVPCKVNVDTFGAMLQAHVEHYTTADPAAARSELSHWRAERLCLVLANFANAPALPMISCGI